MVALGGGGGGVGGPGALVGLGTMAALKPCGERTAFGATGRVLSAADSFEATGRIILCSSFEAMCRIFDSFTSISVCFITNPVRLSNLEAKVVAIKSFCSCVGTLSEKAHGNKVDAPSDIPVFLRSLLPLSLFVSLCGSEVPSLPRSVVAAVGS